MAPFLAQDFLTNGPGPLSGGVANIFGIQDLMGLTAFPPPADKSGAYVEDAAAWYFYDAQSTADTDGVNVLIPDLITAPAPGRWILQEATTSLTDYTEVADANYLIQLEDHTVVLTSVTAPRQWTLPAPIPGRYATYILKDLSGIVSKFPLTVVAAGTTIEGRNSVQLRTDSTALRLYSDGSTYHFLEGARNSGQVKLNTGNGLKPTLVWVTQTIGTFYQIIYAPPLGLSAAPTTTWPRNVSNPTDAHLYRAASNTFLENTVMGQPQRWRVQCSYSGKQAVQDAGIIFRIRNLLSAFVSEIAFQIPGGSASGNFTLEATTIADGASLPAPWGTGQGYVFDMSSGLPVTIVVESITRISEQVD